MRFADADIGHYWSGGAVPRRVPPDLCKRLVRKLQMLDAAASLSDLRIPPANHLEKLSGNHAGQYSIRVNDQWRLIFNWSTEGATDVEFTDYH